MRAQAEAEGVSRLAAAAREVAATLRCEASVATARIEELRAHAQRAVALEQAADRLRIAALEAARRRVIQLKQRLELKASLLSLHTLKARRRLSKKRYEREPLRERKGMMMMMMMILEHPPPFLEHPRKSLLRVFSTLSQKKTNVSLKKIKDEAFRVFLFFLKISPQKKT